MASQISHIIYAQKYFDRLETVPAGIEILPPEDLNRDEFLLGATFPDIRRIDGVIKRKDTHLRFKKLDLDFSGLTSFEAGWKFHLFCDMRREDILNQEGFYKLPRAADFYSYPAKVMEDEIVYDQYNNWEKIVLFFNNPIYINTGVGVSEETFRLWYAILAKYAERKPDEKSMRAYLVKQPSFSKNVESIMETVKVLEGNKKAVKMLEKIADKIVLE